MTQMITTFKAMFTGAAVAISLSYSAPAIAADAAKVDAKMGFQQWKLESPMPASLRPKCEAWFGRQRCYVGSTKFGAGTVGVTLYYYKNLLAEIEVSVYNGTDDEQTKLFLDKLTESYGPAEDAAPLHWAGKKAVITFSGSSRTVSFKSLRLERQQAADAERASQNEGNAKKRANDAAGNDL